jgi:hypothetical protein
MSKPVIRTTYTEHNDLFPRGQHPDERSNKQFCIDMGWRKSERTGRWYPNKKVNFMRIICLTTGKEYKSIRQAAKELNLDNGAIGKHIAGDINYTHVGGLKFERL